MYYVLTIIIYSINRKIIVLGMINSTVKSYNYPQLTFLSASLLQIAGYAIQSAAPPFPVFVISFFINGIGIAIQASKRIYKPSSSTNNSIK